MEELEPVSLEWEDFDTALYKAIDNIAVGNLKLELDLYRGWCFQNFQLAGGRVALWMLCQRYTIPQGCQLLQDLKLGLELKCRDELEEFILEYEILQLRLEQNKASPELCLAVSAAVKKQLEKYFKGKLRQ